MQSQNFLAFLTILVALFVAISNGQSPTCGLSRSDGSIILPSEFVWPDPLPDNWAPEEAEFWSHSTVNTVASVAVSHPHTKYIKAYRYSAKYSMKTTTPFLTFLTSGDNDGNDTIYRTVRFTCADDSSISYNFHIPVEVSDKEVPTFQKPQYTFSISADWPENVSLNQGQFLIVGDGDSDLENALLTFDLLPQGMIDPVGTPLWSESNPPPNGPFNYRVDLYTRPGGGQLTPGRHEFTLVANSRRQSGATSIVVNVTEISHPETILQK